MSRRVIRDVARKRAAGRASLKSRQSSPDRRKVTNGSNGLDFGQSDQTLRTHGLGPVAVIRMMLMLYRVE